MTTATKEKHMVLSRTFNLIMDAWVTGKRRIFLSGGTTSSKTYSAMQFLVLVLENYQEPILATVTSESMPHLRDGALRDFKKIMGEDWDESCWSATTFVYTFPKSGCQLQFVSGDHPERFSGPRRGIWFANELNNIPHGVYREADMRTDLFTIADWNPYGEFWFHEERLYDDPENVYISELTYRDTPEIMDLPEIQSVIRTVESYKDKDPNFYRVHGLGMEGKIEGLVYPEFEIVDELPEGDRIYGLDFGFSVDPTVLTGNVFIGDNLYSKEYIYEKGLTNDDLSEKMDLLRLRKRYDEIYADSASPQAIEELVRLGWNVKPCAKGKGSVEFGHQKVRQYYQHWTKDSINCIKEQRNFRYIEDKNGVLTDKTNHIFSHGMDSLVAGTLITTRRGDVPIEDVVIGDYVCTRKGWRKVLDSFMSHPSKEVMTITFSNEKTITGTPDHLIWIDKKGFTPLDACRYGDIIEVCKEKPLFTLGKNFTGIPNHLIGRIAIIIKAIGVGSVHTSTKRFGKILTGKYPKDSKYTIKMGIQTTIASKILKPLTRINTKQVAYILAGFTTLNILPGFNPLQKNGMLPKKAGNGIGNTPKTQFSIESQPTKYAINAARNSLISDLYHKIDSVQVPVNLNGEETLESTTKHEHVIGAVMNSQSTDMPKQEHARVYVVSVSDVHRLKQPVYDLTIDAVPEFFANGILVHNSRRYCVMTHVPYIKSKPVIYSMSW